MKKIYLLLALVIFMSSCEKEEVFEIQNESSIMHFSTVPQKEAINFLKNVKKSNSNKQSEIVIHYDQLHYDTINNSTELLTVIPAQSKFEEVDSRVLVLEVDGNIEPVLFNLVPEIQNNDTLFTGKIIISNLDLKFITGFRVKNGNFISRFVKKDNLDNSTKCDDGLWDGIDMGCNQTLGEVTLNGSSSTGTPYISISHIYPNSGGGYDDGMSWDYPSRGGGGGGITNPIADEEEKIDDSELKDCHSKIIDALKTINTGIMGKMIEKLAGSNLTDYNWKIDYNMPAGSNPDATATTAPVASNFTSNTHINLNRVRNSTDLSMARTFVHEAIHAFLVYQYRYDQNASELNYTGLLNKYAAQYNTNANDTHHILYLKENLINPIASALQEMGTKKLGYNLPASFYSDLAYGGLYNSAITNTIFNNLVPNQVDRERIKNRLSAETDNLVVNGVSPEGKKAC